MLATRLLGGAAATAFETFLAGEDTQGLAALWGRARQALLDSDDPSPLAHDFMALTIHTLLAALYARIAAAAEAHPDPARLRRLAAHGIATARAFAPAHLARMGL